MTYDTVVLSGGEIKGFALLGALDYLQSHMYLTNVTNWYGTSIGAILGYLMAIGYTPREVLSWMCSREGHFSDVVFSIRGALEGDGATGFGFIQTILENMTLAKRHRFYTLGSLKRETGFRLCAVTYNKTDCKTVCLTPETYPDLQCIIALRMSANFPNLFPRFEYLGKSWVDGAVTNNFPIDLAMADPYVNNMVAITVTQPPTPIETYTGRDPYNASLIPSIIRESYMYLCAVHHELDSYKIQQIPAGSTVIRVPMSSPGLNAVNMTNQDRVSMFEEGYFSLRREYEPDSSDPEEIEDLSIDEVTTAENSGDMQTPAE